MTGSRTLELVTMLEKGRQKTLEVLNSLTSEQWQLPLYEEPVWRVQNLLAHFVSSEKQLLGLLMEVIAGGPGIPLNFDVDRNNADEQERLKDLSPAVLLDLLEHQRNQTLAWVGTLETDQLDKIGRHPVLGEVTVEIMIRAIYGHQLIHMRELSRILMSAV